MAGGFDSLGLMPELLRAVDELDWFLPTDVQDEAIPLILGGGDVCAAAETGSGKTAAFCLPMLQCVHERLRELAEPDSKSRSGGGDPGGGGLPIAIGINPNDKDNLVLVSSDGYEATGQAEKQWTGARATHGIKTGRYYFEVTVLSAGICRVGFSTMAAHHELGRDAHGFGYGGTGMKSFQNAFEKWGEEYGVGDVIGCYLQLQGAAEESARGGGGGGGGGGGAGTIRYSKNGVDLGTAFALSENLRGHVLFPAFVLKGSKIHANFGQAPFLHLNSEDGTKGFAAASGADVVSATSKNAFAVSGKRQPMAIILEPARDLAEQVYNSILAMSQFVTEPALKTLLLIGGGDDHKKVTKELKAGVDIIVGTLGTVSSLVKSGALSLGQIKFFILDEADRMVDNAQNLGDIMALYGACPGGGTGDNRLQVCFFSATLHSQPIQDLAAKICVNPSWVDLKGVESVPETVHHVIYRLDLERDAHLLAGPKTQAVLDGVHDEKDASQIPAQQSLQVKQLKQQVLLRIIDKFEMSQCIIFCRTNVDCDNLEQFLTTHGGGSKFRGRVESGKEHKYSCCVLAGMRSQNERREALTAFKEGEVRFLICTDVAARGIDIKNLPYVVNMTLPDESENYIHRIGRVGRAERMGLAISIVAGNASDGSGLQEKVWYHKCKDRGKGCTNRAVADKGGCTIWYNEPAMVTAIQTRLHMQHGIPELLPDFSLPKEIADLNVEYGELALESAAPSGGRADVHLELLLPTVRELGKMEVSAQSMFHQLQTRFGRFESNDDAFLKSHPDAYSAAAGSNASNPPSVSMSVE